MPMLEGSELIATGCNENMAELEQNQEMISDGTDAIHYAVVEMGGYVRMSELTAEKRRHMYVQERGNMVAANTVGSATIPASHSTTESWIRSWSGHRCQNGRR